MAEGQSFAKKQFFKQLLNFVKICNNEENIDNNFSSHYLLNF